MKRGRPKSAPTDVSGRGRAQSQRDDLTETLIAAVEAQTSDKTATGKGKKKAAAPRTRAHNQPRQTSRRSLMAALAKKLPGVATYDAKGDLILGAVADLLNADDRKLVGQAHQDGITVSDVAALVVYKNLVAMRLYERGELSGKDLIVALDKSTSQAAAAAQLAVGVANKNLPSEVKISMDNKGCAKADIPADVTVQRGEHTVTGDTLAVEGS
jgi:hypothetical protein